MISDLGSSSDVFSNFSKEENKSSHSASSLSCKEKVLVKSARSAKSRPQDAGPALPPVLEGIRTKPCSPADFGPKAPSTYLNGVIPTLNSNQFEQDNSFFDPFTKQNSCRAEDNNLQNEQSIDYHFSVLIQEPK